MNRVQIEISLGIVLVLATSVILLMYGFSEENRLSSYAQAQTGEAIEVGAFLFEQQCSRCHGLQGKGIPGVCPPLNDRNFFDNRMEEVAWSGTLEDYIVATASSGRLASTRPELFPGNGTPAMPAFSDEFGGPLRQDQIRYIAQYIMNWEPYAEVVELPQGPSGEGVGTDITQELPEGDAAEGEALAVAQGCTTCHIDTPTGPAWLPTAGEPGIGSRAAERIEDPGYTGSATTAEQYLFESIVAPEVYLTPGFADLMPHTYGELLSPDDVADLITYLLSIE